MLRESKRNIPSRVRDEVDFRSRRRSDDNSRIMPCEVCDANAGPVLEYHHIRPLEHGGAHVSRNLLKLCPTCHAFVTRDRCRWVVWPRTGLYEPEIAQRLSLLADIQHEPFGLFILGAARREQAWLWLENLTGFTAADIPDGASWGERWRREAKAEV